MKMVSNKKLKPVSRFPYFMHDCKGTGRGDWEESFYYNIFNREDLVEAQAQGATPVFANAADSGVP